MMRSKLIAELRPRREVVSTITKSKMLTGNVTAAWAARLAEVDYIPAFPITPQTEIIEKLSEWIALGEFKAKLTIVDSEHSMLAAAGTASLTGARVFTATSSQGLLYGFEMLYNIAGWRAPIVLVNVSRAVAAPISLEPDHNDFLSTRDSGFILLQAETCQEVLDLILLAYRVSEDNRVLLPSLVNMDGFHTSFTREPVKIPEIEEVRRFLPKYTQQLPFRASKPSAKGVAVLRPPLYSFYKYQMHLSSINAINVFKEACEKFEECFARRYDVIEKYMLDDSKYAIVMMGSYASIGKKAVRILREEGVSVGLLKLRMIRPLPSKDIRKALEGKKAVAVIDQNISPGLGGILYSDISSILYNSDNKPKVILPVIGGVGGKTITLDEIRYVVELLEKYANGGEPEPILLLREDELREVESLLRIGVGE
ncbi:MAG: pyruvate synthase [Aigarchaeota archaeon]|nr:pyruvate synthase [Aigarchaeota archaeon]MCX8193175.1 pyruvate synthase [Nitrososphaeria archaeon]MDW7986316.1 pyruvate synthase [Nitrososphaerota archaeon]